LIKRYFIALFIPLLSYSVQVPVPVYAEASTDKQDQHVIDSLKSIIQAADNDASVCNAYLSWGEEVYLSNPDTALILWQKAHEIAKENLPDRQAGLAAGRSTTLEKKYLWYLAEALNNIGYIHGEQGDIQKQTEYYHKSLEAYEQIGDKDGQAISLNNIGYIYDNQGDIKKALEYYHRSLKIDEEMGNKDGVAMSLNNIGFVYENQGDKEKALKYYHNSLKIREEINDELGISISLNNIGAIYRENEPQKALEYYLRSLKIREDIGDRKGVANSLHNIGFINKNQGDFQEALECYRKSLKIREDIGDRKGAAYSLNNISDVYFVQGDVRKAKDYAKQSMELAKSLGFPENIRDASQKLSIIHRKEGKYQDALEMYEIYIQMRDSIVNEETQKESIRQQTKYEFEKAQMVKEQEEKEKARLEAETTARRDNLQYSGISIILVLLVIALVLVSSRGQPPLEGSVPKGRGVSPRLLEGMIFFTFLIFFEFLLVLADPYIDNWSGGAPGIKLLFNASIAALIFPLHSLFEAKLKGRLVP